MSINSKTVMIVVGALLALLALFFAFKYFTKNSLDSTSNNPEESSACGKAFGGKPCF